MWHLRKIFNVRSRAQTLAFFQNIEAGSSLHLPWACSHFLLLPEQMITSFSYLYLYKFIILQFCGFEAEHRSRRVKIKVSTHCIFCLETTHISWLLASFLHLQSQQWQLRFFESEKWKCQLLRSVRLFVTPRTAGCQPPPWHSPGKNAGMGSHSILQGFFLTQGSNPGLLHCRQIPHHLSHQESPSHCIFLLEAAHIPSLLASFLCLQSQQWQLWSFLWFFLTTARKSILLLKIDVTRWVSLNLSEISFDFQSHYWS